MPESEASGRQMRRRDFIKFVAGSAAVWPLTTRAQQSKLVRIGALYQGLADADSFKEELREGLRELGYVEGQDIAFEFRSAEGHVDRLPALAVELVQLKVDVIVALYLTSALAAKQATQISRSSALGPTRSKVASSPAWPVPAETLPAYL